MRDLRIFWLRRGRMFVKRTNGRRELVEAPFFRRLRCPMPFTNEVRHSLIAGSLTIEWYSGPQTYIESHFVQE